MMDMDVNAHRVFSEVAENAAGLLGKSLMLLGSLKGSKLGPLPERNTVVHLAAALIDRGYAVCAEPALDGKERVDLVASDKAITFVIETKTFGRPTWDTVLSDAMRVYRYRPQASARTDGMNPVAFWGKSERWGCVVVQCWNSKATDPWRALVESGSATAELAHLAAWLKTRGAKWGMSSACGSFVAKKDPMFLLWAIFKIDGERAPSQE